MVVGCGMKVDYISISPHTSEAKPSSYNIPIFELNENISEYKIIGKVAVGEAGMTANCGYDDVLKKAQEKAAAPAPETEAQEAQA